MYLAPGFLFAAACQAAFGFPKVLGQQITVIDGLFLVLAIYVIGHVLAHLAKFVLEAGLVDRALKSPIANLFCKPNRTLRRLFPGYYNPVLPPVRSELGDKSSQAAGEELY